MEHCGDVDDHDEHDGIVEQDGEGCYNVPQAL